MDQKKFAQAESVLQPELLSLGDLGAGGHPMDGYRLLILLGYAIAAQQRWTTAAPLLRDGYEGMIRNAAAGQDQEDIADAGELVVKAYTQWGKQPAATADWKQRVAGDDKRLATAKP